MQQQPRRWSFALGLGFTAQGLLICPFLPLLVIGLVTAFRGHMNHGDWNVLKSGAIGSAVCVATIVFNPYRSALLDTYRRMLHPRRWSRKGKLIGVGVLVLLIVGTPFVIHQQRIADSDKRKQIKKVNAALAIVEAGAPATTAGVIALLQQHQEEIGLAPVSGAAGENKLSVAATANQVALMTSSLGECIAVVDVSETGLWHIVYLPSAGDHCDASQLPTPKNGGQVGLFHGSSWSPGPLRG